MRRSGRWGILSPVLAGRVWKRDKGGHVDVINFILILTLGAVMVATGFYLLREIRRTGAAAPSSPARLDTLNTELDARYQLEVERLRAEARGAIAEIEKELDRLRAGLRTSTHEQDSQLVRLRERYAELDGQTTGAVEEALADLRDHHDAELGRLREAIGAAIAAIVARQPSAEATALAHRRAEAIDDLYRRLAKFETAFGSVTNPVLLPGESFVLPADLAPETLRWENWKEVGDAAFAFAETFNHHRIHLDDATCRDLTAFVAELRGLLTRSIYPNLVPNPTNGDEAQQSLRAALKQLGAEIPRARDHLERAYREHTAGR